MCICQLFIMLVFINYSAVLPLLRAEWGMSNTQAGMIFSVYQLGYIASGVILSTLTDRMNTRVIFITAAFWSAAANLLFALYAHDFTSGMILRALTGIGMGGTYMPGLKLVAERFEPATRGRAIGIYVGSLVLGASLSLAATGWLTGLAGWRIAFICCSVSVCIGALLSFFIFRGYQPVTRIRTEAGFNGEVARNRPALLMILGYGAHMWEMYGMRSWLAPFMTSALIGWGVESARATGLASTVAAVMVGIGAFSTAITGTLSDRFGRTATISMVMLASALLLLRLRLADQHQSLADTGYRAALRLPGRGRIAGLLHRPDRTGGARLPGGGHGVAVPDRLFHGHDLTDGLRLGTGHLQGLAAVARHQW